MQVWPTNLRRHRLDRQRAAFQQMPSAFQTTLANVLHHRQPHLTVVKQPRQMIVREIHGAGEIGHIQRLREPLFDQHLDLPGGLRGPGIAGRAR